MALIGACRSLNANTRSGTTKADCLLMLGLRRGEHWRSVMMQVKASVRKHMPRLRSLSLNSSYTFDQRLEGWVTRTRDYADPLALDEELDDGINRLEEYLMLQRMVRALQGMNDVPASAAAAAEYQLVEMSRP